MAYRAMSPSSRCARPVELVRLTPTGGKAVCGGTDDGMVHAEKRPARQRQNVTKRIAFERRRMNRLKPVSRPKGSAAAAAAVSDGVAITSRLEARRPARWLRACL